MCIYVYLYKRADKETKLVYYVVAQSSFGLQVQFNINNYLSPCYFIYMLVIKV